MKSDFANRIHSVFEGTLVVPPTAPPDIKTALFDSARDLQETAFKFPTRGASRSSGGNRRPHTFGGAPTGAAVSEPGPLRRKRPLTAPGDELEQDPGVLPLPSVRNQARTENLTRRIDSALSELAPAPGAAALPTPGGAEGLRGMGAEHQPADLFQRFNAALQELGTQTNGAPLQDELKKVGIKWKKADDGQALIFFVKNGDTGVAQPIARIGASTISKPQEFQKALSQMLDLSKGQAPGTEEQKQAEAQEVQKRLREIATNMAPQDPDKQAATAQAGMMAPAGGAGPAAPGAGVTPGAGPPEPQVKPQPKPQNPKVSNLAAQVKKPKTGGGGSLGPVGPRPTTRAPGAK